MKTKVNVRFDAVKMKSELQRRMNNKIRAMQSSMSSPERINAVARSGALGKWWESLRKD